ncbi:metallophosphoesterase, partial [Botryobacter ruber]|uniref:metallophosphoesterase n=1 Tax=Botryobacter ruber TaxID=2171629 RepID=UPI0014794A0C
MRIVQLSDIHLSNTNLEDLRNHYLESLLNDLENYNKQKPIDVILFTGDLVDKGGASLGDNPYEIFENELITPIIKALAFDKNKILFIPGNHDIDVNLIDEDNEFKLSRTLTGIEANKIIKDQAEELKRPNQRIKKFKEFEKRFHSQNDDYIFTFNESLIIENALDHKVGFALINDSWRCSPSLNKEDHFIGTTQLFNAYNFFRKKDTDINIAVFHHPIESFNTQETEEVENILKSKNYEIVFCGHNHHHKSNSIFSSEGGYLLINGRSAFNDTNEKQARYQPGYNILDLDIKSRSYVLHARKYIASGYRFDKDVESLKDGIHSGRLSPMSLVPLSNDSNAHESDLPNGYSADVNRIVKLLIGKSLYPNQYIFVRELIQNSVDACDRIKRKYPDLTPKVVVKINIKENYFEVIDEGDGMSKKVLRDHFSIIGKSISQEYISSNGSYNLISQFGIGFISTFIVARKVSIKTRSEDNELIHFEIEDVFKGFNFNASPQQEDFLPQNTGTQIRVTLRSEFSNNNLLSIAKTFCRHITNLEIYLDEVQQAINDSWNLDGGLYFDSRNNEKYQFKLTISADSRDIIATNKGFLITRYSPQIIPFKFPHIIGGEVIFEPRAIELDLSRTNIHESEKALEFKKDLSNSLRALFSKVIDSNDINLLPLVLNYLKYYLINFEVNQQQVSESYSNFFTKTELLLYC